MPRIVDHEQRRRELAEAVWRVIRRDGVQSASVRSVAREADWSAGSLRHYFPSKNSLLAFAMQLVTDQVRARVLALPVAGAPAEVAVRRCEQVLPLDAERRAEAEVWLALTATSLTDPTLRTIRETADAGLRELCGRLLDWLSESCALPPRRTTELEAERLRALLDGLTLHLLLDPDPSPEHVQRVLSHHLTDLLA